MTSLHNHFKDRAIYPVILSVPAAAQEMTPRQRVTYLSGHARRALEISAAKSDLVLGQLAKDDRGVPQPFDGIFWSLTHKPEYVAGVVAQQPIGIDLEKIRPCSDGLFRKTATDAEWTLADRFADRLAIFFRYWTAKEAVLKAGGTGLTGLSKCRIVALDGDTGLSVDYQDRTWQIEHYFFDGHLASVVTHGCHVEWTVAKG
jgi:4'-phosphopantetheinyl transferase